MKNRKQNVTRRNFLATSAATTLGAATIGSVLSQPAQAAEESKCEMKKALIGPAEVGYLEKIKAAGFDGIETQAWNVDEKTAEAGRKAADQTGMKIQSVMRAWTNVNNDDPAKVQADIESVEHALRSAEIYGAGAVLLVPCRIGGFEMPKPWDFDIEFDKKTCMISKVVAGDNAPYAAYIEAQNRSTEMSLRAVEKMIPAAEKTGVVIGLENVWNNLWVTPKLFAAFVRKFDCPWVKAYYDIGNHVKYADSVQWIKELGDLLVRVHVKDFAVDHEKGSGGSFVNIREGDVDWPAVRKALDEVGYCGWMTIEGSGGLSYDELSKRLDLIIAGK